MENRTEDLRQISESLRYDSLIDKLNDGETLTLKELFILQKKINKLIEEHVCKQTLWRVFEN